MTEMQKHRLKRFRELEGTTGENGEVCFYAYIKKEGITHEGVSEVSMDNAKMNAVQKYERLIFEAAVRPVIKYLCESRHPYSSIYITPTSAELSEGCMGTGKVLDYVLD